MIIFIFAFSVCQNNYSKGKNRTPSMHTFATFKCYIRSKSQLRKQTTPTNCCVCVVSEPHLKGLLGIRLRNEYVLDPSFKINLDLLFKFRHFYVYTKTFNNYLHQRLFLVFIKNKVNYK